MVFIAACIITYFTPYCYFVKINFLMPFLAMGYWLNKQSKYHKIISSNFLFPLDQLPNLNQKQNLNELLVIKYLRTYRYSDSFPCGCCVNTLWKSS